MSFSLTLGTEPAGLRIKTCGFSSMSQTVYLGDYEISMEDFLNAVDYVLTNTDLYSNDPRLEFVKYVQSLQKVEGYSSDKNRLKAFCPMNLSEISPQ